MIMAVIVVLLMMSITTIALSGFLGYRDGGNQRQTIRAAAMVDTAFLQATLGFRDLESGQWEIAFNRCDYAAKQMQPGNSAFQGAMASCRSTAMAAINATNTPTTAPSPVPPTLTPSTTPSGPSGDFSLDDMYNRAQDAIRKNDYETAVSWLEAVRAKDYTYRRLEVEDALVNAYLTLAGNYRFTKSYSQMIIVVRKAQKIRSIDNTDWVFTANMAELYMSARSHLDSQQYALAAQVFKTLMTSAPQFSDDLKTLACQAFQLAGDTTSQGQFCR